MSLGASLAAVGCQGQVGGPTAPADAGWPTHGQSSDLVENPRTTDSSDNVASLGGTSPVVSTSTATSVPPTTAPPTLPLPTPSTTAGEPTEDSDDDTSSSAAVGSETSAPWSSSSESTEASSGSTNDSDGQSAFDIEVEFLSSANQLSVEVRSSFLEAEAFWENVIVGDLPDVDLRFEMGCVPEQNAYVQGLIDDLHIFVAARSIDGVDGVLGAAGPCLSHSSRNNLPIAGYMEFDTADLQRYADEGRLDEIIIHEMGHVLGFGGQLWTYPQDSLGGDAFLVNATNVEGGDPSPPPDTHFVGLHAMAEFDAIGGSAYVGAKVPVENIGGAGTANGHWREEVMGNELMTSFMTNREGVLSSVTIAALEDMGYTVNYDAADDYVWPPPDERGSFLRGGEQLSPIDFSNDILQLPMRNVDD